MAPAVQTAVQTAVPAAVQMRLLQCSEAVEKGLQQRRCQASLCSPCWHQQQHPAEHHDLLSCVDDSFHKGWGSIASCESMRDFRPRLLALYCAGEHPSAKPATDGVSLAIPVQFMCRQMCSA